jgi:DNA modification methylase
MKKSPILRQAVTVPVSSLKPYPNNPRTHTPKQIRQIADSILKFGFTNSVIIDKDDVIVAGHDRVEAAKLLGLVSVPAVRLEDLTPSDIRMYRIADNRLAELSKFDDEIVSIELQNLVDDPTVEDVTLTGFEMAEIDIKLEGLSQPRKDPDDRVPALPEGAPVCRPGDLWAVGPHRLYCGDATKSSSYARLLADRRAQMVFCDLPYNVKVGGHVSGLGKVQHREFAMASGEMSASQFADFMKKVFANLVAFSVNGSIHYQCIDWRHAAQMEAVGLEVYSEIKNYCVWVKTNGGMGSLYRSRHEFVLVFKSGDAPHINNVELGRHGRYRTNVWEYAGMNSFGKGRDKKLASHPTVKPVAMVADAIYDCSNRGGIILDACSGSGTTVVAAHRTGRRGFGIELDCRYADVTLKRLQEATKQEPVLLPLEEPFDVIAKEREAENAVSETEAGRKAA